MFPWVWNYCECCGLGVNWEYYCLFVARLATVRGRKLQNRPQISCFSPESCTYALRERWSPSLAFTGCLREDSYSMAGQHKVDNNNPCLLHTQSSLVETFDIVSDRWHSNFLYFLIASLVSAKFSITIPGTEIVRGITWFCVELDSSASDGLNW